MLLGLLLGALTATITISSSTSVQTTGMPEGAVADYSRTASTGMSGQMTKGNATKLVLTGWDGCTLESVSLRMHSNKSAGAGSLRMRVGNSVVWEIADNDFANVAWNGTFSSDWVDIEKEMSVAVGGDEEIEVYIEASKNSLYIESYTIVYEPAVRQAGEVVLVTGLDRAPIVLTEPVAGDGVVLPALADTAEWHFQGWSEREIQESASAPKVWGTGRRYFPSGSRTLWAVYADGEGGQERVSDYVSGKYVVVDTLYSAAMTGPVVALTGSSSKKYVQTSPVTVSETEDGALYLDGAIDGDMVYQVEFLQDSMLTIRNANSGSYVGYSGIYLSDKAVEWRYRVLSDGSLAVWHTNKGRDYALFFSYGVEYNCPDDVIVYSTGINIPLYKKGGIVLFPAEELVYTSWPFGRYSDVPTPETAIYERDRQDVKVYFGIYEVHIKNGKKQIRLHK